ncbi:MAG: hypothetical protein ACREJ4_00670 [Candidatus Methylomirabilaceae bacterium]
MGEHGGDDLYREERIARGLANNAGPEHAELRGLIAELVEDLDRELARRDALIQTSPPASTSSSRQSRASSAWASARPPRSPSACPSRSRRNPGASPETATVPRPTGRYRPASGPGAGRPPARGLPGLRREIEAGGEAIQWIEDIAVTTVITKVAVAKGRCRCCRRCQGRHPEQVSDALGAAGSHLGACVQGLIAILAKECGLSHGKVARVARQLGIRVTTGGGSQVLAPPGGQGGSHVRGPEGGRGRLAHRGAG